MIMENYATKDDLKNLKEDLQNFMGALYEKFHSDVQFLAEQMSSMGKQFIETNRKVDLLIDTVGMMQVDITEIKEKLDRKVDQRDHQLLAERVSALEATM